MATYVLRGAPSGDPPYITAEVWAESNGNGSYTVYMTLNEMPSSHFYGYYIDACLNWEWKRVKESSPSTWSSGVYGATWWNVPYGYTIDFDVGGDTAFNSVTPDYPKVYNNINALNPYGNEHGLMFDLKTSDGSNWYNLTNEPSDFRKPSGTVATIYNIRSNHTGAHFSSISGASSIGGGQYQWTMQNDSQVIILYSEWDSFTLTVNARTDGNNTSSSSGYGTFDVYINGSRDSTGVTSFSKTLTYGTTFSISNIVSTVGHTYTGVYSGSTSGTITTSDITTRLNFVTNDVRIKISSNSWKPR